MVNPINTIIPPPLPRNCWAALPAPRRVRNGISRASATVDVSLAAGEATADLLVDMKGLAVQASQEGLDQTSHDAINAQFNALRHQISSINDSASFGGGNLIAAATLETHNELLGVQNDTLKAGIGELIDADMAEESATMVSGQIKQSLDVISLNIANAALGRLVAMIGG